MIPALWAVLGTVVVRVLSVIMVLVSGVVSGKVGDKAEERVLSVLIRAIFGPVMVGVKMMVLEMVVTGAIDKVNVLVTVMVCERIAIIMMIGGVALDNRLLTNHFSA